MDDKNVMEDLLLAEKGVCDLYMHGTIESATTNVHHTFDTALQDSLAMQNEIYGKMSQNGWYQTQTAQQQQIEQVKTKFQAQKNFCSQN